MGEGCGKGRASVRAGMRCVIERVGCAGNMLRSVHGVGLERVECVRAARRHVIARIWCVPRADMVGDTSLPGVGERPDMDRRLNDVY